MSINYVIYTVDLNLLRNHELIQFLSESAFEFYLTDALFFNEESFELFTRGDSDINNITFFVEDKIEVYDFLSENEFKIQESENTDVNTELLMCLKNGCKSVYVRIVRDIFLKKKAQVLLKSLCCSDHIISINAYNLLRKDKLKNNEFIELGRIWRDGYNIIKDFSTFSTFDIFNC